MTALVAYVGLYTVIALAVAAYLVSAVALGLLIGKTIRNRDRQVPHTERGNR